MGNENSSQGTVIWACARNAPALAGAAHRALRCNCDTQPRDFHLNHCRNSTVVSTLLEVLSLPDPMAAEPFSFAVAHTAHGTAARAGTLLTPHGSVETPVFMPVGTQATVKAMSPEELRAGGAQIILANTYHLHLRPGSDIIAEAGGLHRFESWDRAMLTDSGGYQVFSLQDISKITDEGVSFQSHLDGSRHFFSPERAVEIQRALGADVIMAFDECPPSDAPAEQVAAAVERTVRWAVRCAEAHARLPFAHGYPQAMFPVVQGGTVRALRERCVSALVQLDAPGYAVGGCAVGEANEVMHDVVRSTAAMLPADRPRYLMGVGMPQDILECIDRGVDLFDCVLPTRCGRTGTAFTSRGRVNIRNAQYARDFGRGLDPDCRCPACTGFSRAYLRHLVMAGEILGIRLMTLHNTHFFLTLARTARQRILDGTFAEWKAHALSAMGPVRTGEPSPSSRATARARRAARRGDKPEEQNAERAG